MLKRTHKEQSDSNQEDELLALGPLLVQEKKKKSKYQSQSQLSNNFPDEVVVEILTRLPVKSLGRFSCVSESWLSLISSPSFIKSHQKRCRENKEKNRLVFVTVEEEEEENGGRFRLSQFECSLDDAFSKASPKEIKVTNNVIINPPVEFKGLGTFKILSSYDGLVLITTDETNLFLWNPATKRCRKLPNCSMKKEYKGFSLSFMSYGIGYDASNDDYKVLVISCVLCDNFENETLVKVYSRNTDSWKEIEDFNYHLVDGGCYYVNGKFHFRAEVILNHELRIIQRKLVTLDLENDVFGEIELPDCVDKKWALGMLGGCLSLSFCSRDNQVDIWVMKEYGVNESWSNIAVRNCWVPDGGIFGKPLILSKEGQLLFMTSLRLSSRTKLGFYDLKDKSFRYPQFSNLKEVYGMDLYVESLLSP